LVAPDRAVKLLPHAAGRGADPIRSDPRFSDSRGMRVSFSYIAILVAILVAVIAITMLVMRFMRWRRDVALRQHGVPMLVMPIAAGEPMAPRPMLAREEIQTTTPRLSIPAVSPTATIASRRTTPRSATPAPDEKRGAEQQEAEVIDTGPFRPGQVQAGSPSAHLVAGSQVRFFRAEEGTLEFLPGRLEVVDGEDVGQEIHFVRQPGEDTATITFGRSEGTPLRHVQLLDPTVSRQHGRMTWIQPSWYLVNLSSTNPVIVNEEALPTGGKATILTDGDRIEMGSVVFVFHAP
jgi:pSer/pThr/pTyr-binding forkhead associated (FHA) protein